MITLNEEDAKTIGIRVSVEKDPQSDSTEMNIRLKVPVLSKPFVCKICCRRFRTENTMQLHYRTHNQEPQCHIQNSCGPSSNSSAHSGGASSCSQVNASLESSDSILKEPLLLKCAF